MPAGLEQLLRAVLRQDDLHGRVPMGAHEVHKHAQLKGYNVERRKPGIVQVQLRDGEPQIDSIARHQRAKSVKSDLGVGINVPGSEAHRGDEADPWRRTNKGVVVAVGLGLLQWGCRHFCEKNVTNSTVWAFT